MVLIRVSPLCFLVYHCILALATMYTVEFYFHQSAPKYIYILPSFLSLYHSTWCIQAPAFAWSFSDEVINLGPFCILVRRSAQSTKNAQVLQGSSISASSALFHHRPQPIIIFWDVDFYRLIFSATIEIIGVVVLKQSLLIPVWY